MTDFFDDSSIIYNSFQKIFYSFDSHLRTGIMIRFHKEVNTNGVKFFHGTMLNQGKDLMGYTYVLTNAFYSQKDNQIIQNFMKKVVEKFNLSN